MIMRLFAFLSLIFLSIFSNGFCQGKIFELFDEFPREAFIQGHWQAAWWSPPPKRIQARMEGKSFNAKTPVQMGELAYVLLSHFNEEGEVQRGELVFHKKLAPEIIEIFHELFEKKYPIAKMKLIDDYDGDDLKSMEDNNTCAFATRPNTTAPSNLSKHSFGGTIDINPAVNPYVKGSTILPQKGKKYLQRDGSIPGLIVEGDACHEAFTKRGYVWGGDFQGRTDYQHFEKDPNKPIEG